MIRTLHNKREYFRKVYYWLKEYDPKTTPITITPITITPIKKIICKDYSKELVKP